MFPGCFSVLCGIKLTKPKYYTYIHTYNNLISYHTMTNKQIVTCIMSDHFCCVDAFFHASHAFSFTLNASSDAGVLSATNLKTMCFDTPESVVLFLLKSPCNSSLETVCICLTVSMYLHTWSMRVCFKYYVYLNCGTVPISSNSFSTKSNLQFIIADHGRVGLPSKYLHTIYEIYPLVMSK